MEADFGLFSRAREILAALDLPDDPPSPALGPITYRVDRVGLEGSRTPLARIAHAGPGAWAGGRAHSGAGARVVGVDARVDGPGVEAAHGDALHEGGGPGGAAARSAERSNKRGFGGGSPRLRQKKSAVSHASEASDTFLVRSRKPSAGEAERSGKQGFGGGSPQRPTWGRAGIIRFIFCVLKRELQSLEG